MDNQPKVVLGINSYTGKEGERCKLLPHFLDTILEHTNYKNYSLVLYDDCSPRDDLKEIFFKYSKKFDIPFEYVRGEKPLVRWHRVRNALIECCQDYRPDYYFLYDDDYKVVQKNWMTHIVGCMENIPEIGILCAHYARLADGKTRQKQHAPYCFECNKHARECGCPAVIMDGDFAVRTTKWATGGCWTIRPEVIEQAGLYPEIKYDDGEPGADTWMGWEMMKKTNYKLCTTMIDMVLHTGQEFMRGKFANKYQSKEFQSGKRLY